MKCFIYDEYKEKTRYKEFCGYVNVTNAESRVFLKVLII